VQHAGRLLQAGARFEFDARISLTDVDQAQTEGLPEGGIGGVEERPDRRAGVLLQHRVVDGARAGTERADSRRRARAGTAVCLCTVHCEPPPPNRAARAS
jgi:hypothetical protein